MPLNMKEVITYLKFPSKVELGRSATLTLASECAICRLQIFVHRCGTKLMCTCHCMGRMDMVHHTIGSRYVRMLGQDAMLLINIALHWA